MTAKFFAILTNQGAARLANAVALGTKLNLTQMAVGDANGTLPTPDPAQTKLINQKRIASLNLLTVDPANTSQIIAEQIIPENEGGFWIREIGLYDDAGVLIAVANCPETYKPQLQEGSGRTQTIRMILIVSSTSAITLKIDPSVVLATRQYVDGKIIEVKAYADSLLAAHLAAADPHPQYLKTVDIGKYIPVGFPLPWPQATPPEGWLKCNGAPFDKLKYPKLAVAYPSGNLPDLRGEFIRGVDDGRGVDSERGVLSLQSALSHDHRHYLPTLSGSGGDGTMTAVFTDNTNAISYFPNGYDSYNPNPSSGTTLQTYSAKSYSDNFGNESRPRNIAFNYIVRAA
ncbi:phage tail-collar fiber domain-containing protein [Escherichia coli]|uniref:phage tail-collar fiber domain-containing protein n=1 Tax=Escherichia coli TaxID=562 RepID=UPI001B17D336|nr:phage tail protein [Escherichia coli]EFS7693539.1 phage tail protein [Escherichia coli]EIP7733345.1 phage tail protein [Escherichia coli]HBA2653525.1 phage tail protein [Escherichia coli]HBA2659356.1 phage tail protein [Escherichia coli]HEA0522308.1 phage tail protein [Escherichia coli]